MPHDKFNRLIEIGDIVKVPALNLRRIVVGPVCSMHSPNSQVCTGQVLCPIIGGSVPDYFNAQDAELILKKDGTEPGTVVIEPAIVVVEEKPKETENAT